MHVAILIDDGPTAEHCLKFLALFEKEKIHATFSLVAKNIELHPDLAKAMIAAGHEIANHSYAHLHPKDLSDKELDHEVAYALQIIKETTGVTPIWYWPPFVEITPGLEAAVGRTPMKIFRPQHLVASGDYIKELSADEIRKRALTGIDDGTVILFHEWREETLDQMPQIIAELRKQGAIFMTISELTNRH